MNKKGFTLIELLAVIVILAIIALIATPAVLNIIEDSRKGAAEASARNIVSAAKTYYMQQTMQGGSVEKIDLSANILKYNGDQAEKGYIEFTDGKPSGKLYIGGYCVEININGKVESEKVDNEDCTMGVTMVTLTLNADGGELVETAKTYNSGDKLGELPTPTKEGYTFKGWILADGTNVTSETVITENMTINASWEANTYTITLSDGDDTTVDQTMQVTYDSVYGNLPEPTKSGYAFIGWKLEDGTDINNESIVEIFENHTLYAQWSIELTCEDDISKCNDVDECIMHHDLEICCSTIHSDGVTHSCPQDI